jgi:hypothetical protein
VRNGAPVARRSACHPGVNRLSAGRPHSAVAPACPRESPSASETRGWRPCH